jgi:hypothetical protein
VADEGGWWPAFAAEADFALEQVPVPRGSASVDFAGLLFLYEGAAEGAHGFFGLASDAGASGACLAAGGSVNTAVSPTPSPSTTPTFTPSPTPSPSIPTTLTATPSASPTATPSTPASPSPSRTPGPLTAPFVSLPGPAQDALSAGMVALLADPAGQAQAVSALAGAAFAPALLAPLLLFLWPLLACMREGAVGSGEWARAAGAALAPAQAAAYFALQGAALGESWLFTALQGSASSEWGALLRALWGTGDEVALGEGAGRAAEVVSPTLARCVAPAGVAGHGVAVRVSLLRSLLTTSTAGSAEAAGGGSRAARRRPGGAADRRSDRAAVAAPWVAR